MIDELSPLCELEGLPEDVAQDEAFDDRKNDLIEYDVVKPAGRGQVMEGGGVDDKTRRTTWPSLRPTS